MANLFQNVRNCILAVTHPQEYKVIRSLQKHGFKEVSEALPSLNPAFSLWNHPILTRPVTFKKAHEVMARVFEY